MHPEIAAAVEALRLAVQKNASPRAVAFRLFVNCEGCQTEFEERTPEGLRSGGISMRNIAGEFIK